MVNLIHNAVQACRGQGHIVIETGNSERSVRLRMSDDGCGMDSELMEHVFDPFLTTRQGQGGTGLGLSIVHGIVTSHGGSVRVESLTGKGSTFFIELPREAAHGEGGSAPLRDGR